MNVDKLQELKACSDAVEWVETQPDAETAWAKCRRGDWMLWLAGMASGKPESRSRKKLVLCACEVARQALKYVPAGEDRPRIAIETAESWARNAGPTLSDVRAASKAASDAAWAASKAASDAASGAASKASADIVRKHYPKPPKLGRGHQ